MSAIGSGQEEMTAVGDLRRSPENEIQPFIRCLHIRRRVIG